MVANTILELIGASPLIRINKLNSNRNVDLYVKLESMNPGGSIKDRIALAMIEDAEQQGLLTRDKIVLEASSGNTAIGLAMVCAVKGYKLMVTMSESASEERKKILRAYGAEIRLTPGHLATDGAIEEAYRLAREEPDRYFLTDQYNSDSNWQAHYRHTSNEIWRELKGKIDVVIVTMGTTGTLMGITRRLKELNPGTRIIGVEPYVGHKIQGLKNMKESYAPGIFKPSEPDAIINVDDERAYACARELAKKEGILVGMSAGAALIAALDEADKLSQGTIVAILPDGGERYLSTSLFQSEILPHPLVFYNTLSRSMEPLEPVQPGNVKIYSCGPSLDGPPDMGLCRRLVFADLVRRYIEYRGFRVKHVMNLGDSDDRTISECLKGDQDLKNFTDHWQHILFAELNNLRILQADHYPRASDHISNMIDLTRRLLDKGLAYEKLRSVYFNISRFKYYGRLSGFDLGRVKSDQSIDYDYYEKENPRDFALFKRSTLPELKKGIYWNTPWGAVRPGWHIECACLGPLYLGRMFDIHTASVDLIFPHGDNEIAITEAAYGTQPVKIWLHSEVVMFEGKKINRADGNILTLDDVRRQGYDNRTIRFWLLQTHYRKVLKYSRESMTQAQQAVERINRFVYRLVQCHTKSKHPDLDQMLYHTRTSFHEAMDNDLNISLALGHVFSFIRNVNPILTIGQLDESQKQQIFEMMKGLDTILAIIDFPLTHNEEIQALVKKRENARRQKDFKTADTIRLELARRGIAIGDTPVDKL